MLLHWYSESKTQKLLNSNLLKLDHRKQKNLRHIRRGVLATAWRDKKAKKPVVVVSTKGVVGDVVVNRKGGVVSIPAVIEEYNHNMNGCDKIDQMITYYGHFQRKTKKWWKRIFHWLLGIIQVNSYIIFKLANNNAKLSLKKFQQATATQLLEKAAPLADDAPVRRSVGRPPANPVERLESNKHLIDWVKNDRSCKVCSGPGNRKRTNFVCTGCSDRPHLHPKGCFKAYHSKVNFSQL